MKKTINPITTLITLIGLFLLSFDCSLIFISIQNYAILTTLYALRLEELIPVAGDFAIFEFELGYLQDGPVVPVVRVRRIIMDKVKYIWTARLKPQRPDGCL